MEKYRYCLELRGEEPSGEGNGTDSAQTVRLQFDNHDDIFRIIGKMKESGNFSDGDESAMFAIGLKLFSSVMIRHRESELFRDFEPAFREFMKKLKGR